MKPSIKTSSKAFAKFLPLSLLLGMCWFKVARSVKSMILKLCTVGLFPLSSVFTIGCWQPANLRTASKDLQQDMYLEGIALRLEPCVTWYSTKTLEDGSSALSQAKGFSSERNNLYKIIWNKEWENLFHFVFSGFFH